MTRWTVALAIAAVGTAACTAGMTDTPTPTGDTGEPTGGAPTMTELSAEVFQPTCALVSCHAAGSQATSGLELVEGNEWEALVNVVSPTVSTATFVVPGDPATSYLVAKLEDAVGITGSPMPPPFGGLEAAKIQMIKDWITAGALDN